jgi:sterol desaturase/sphingolipid hydroxylase (fatty acid hydroxylase superfamily)
MVSLEVIGPLPVAPLGWLLAFILWFVMWAPLVALLEYGTHRWIMHKGNRILDPKLEYLKYHRAHHRGANDDDFVDVPLKDCLLLTSPFFFLLAVWGLAIGSPAAVAIPATALLAWCFFYTCLWARVHRAIHGIEMNWFQRSGSVFRFYRDRHLQHHVNAKVNYGTLFPWTDYLFFTWRDRKATRASPSESGTCSFQDEFDGRAEDARNNRRERGLGYEKGKPRLY